MSAGAAEGLTGPAPLARRLSWVTAFRLVLLAVLLGWIGRLNFHGSGGTFTVQTALGTLAVAFALTALYAGLLRRGRHLEQLVTLQIVVDPFLWTVIVYLSGGPSSGATSFYGLNCLIGALLIGLRGAALALGLGVACFVTLLVGLSGGWIEPPPDQPSELYLMSAEEFTYTGVVNLVAMMVVTLLSGSLAERLRVAGGQLLRAEQRAEHAERLAALGRVATALAHEIRNPLGAISGSIQLLRASPALSPEDARLCGIIVREAGRLDDLVSDMMNLARPRKPELVSVDAAATARDVVALAAQSGRAVSDVTLRYGGPETARIHADPGQLRQLMWNLVRNAVQASHAGGEVLVEIRRRGAGVELSVHDEGVGLSDEARTRIFDAFFTTRAQGTGVGLAVVKRIADDHDFRLDVESAEGRGTTFRVDMGRATRAPVGTRVDPRLKQTLFPRTQHQESRRPAN